jgi:hypothetical protein
MLAAAKAESGPLFRYLLLYLYQYSSSCKACRSHFPSLPTILLSSPQFLTLFLSLMLMSHTHFPSTSSNFRLIFDNALKAYEKRTKKDLLTHPLADRLESCDSASNILTVLQEQVQELNQSQRRFSKWLEPTVNVLHAFSETLGEGVGSVCFKFELVQGLPSHLFGRHSHPQRKFLLDLVSFFQCVPFLIPSCGPS